MILSVNANAAIDKTVVVNRFHLGEIYRPEKVLAIPGGKGINCARSLKRLGERPVVTGWVGGFAGQFIEQGLRQEDIEPAFVHTAFESRTCLSILDPVDQTLTEIYEKGDAVPADKVAEFKQQFAASIGQYTAVTFSGSLPPGVPLDFYGQLLELARTAGVPGFLDSSGEALRQGIEVGRPYLVKPNRKELGDVLGKKLESLKDCIAAAVEVAARVQARVVISLGGEGAVAVNESEILYACPPRVTIQSAVGSGDCMLGGIVYGLTHALSFEEAIKYGVAAGTANALTVGAGNFTMDDFRRILSGVTITRY